MCLLASSRLKNYILLLYPTFSMKRNRGSIAISTDLFFSRETNIKDRTNEIIRHFG